MTTDSVQSLSNEHDYVFVATSVSKDAPKGEHVYITQCSSICIPKCQVKVQGQYVEMVVGSAASVNILESATFHRLRDQPPLQASTRVYPYGSDTPVSLESPTLIFSTMVHNCQHNLTLLKAITETRIQGSRD